MTNAIPLNGAPLLEVTIRPPGFVPIEAANGTLEGDTDIPAATPTTSVTLTSCGELETPAAITGTVAV